MNLHLLRTPEGTELRTAPWCKHKPTKWGPDITTDVQLGVNLYVDSEWDRVRFITARLLPNVIKNPINETRVKLKAARMGRVVLAKQAKAEIKTEESELDLQQV